MQERHKSIFLKFQYTRFKNVQKVQWGAIYFATASWGPLKKKKILGPWARAQCAHWLRRPWVCMRNPNQTDSPMLVLNDVMKQSRSFEEEAVDAVARLMKSRLVAQIL